jgi:hypothetical protein
MPPSASTHLAIAPSALDAYPMPRRRHRDRVTHLRTQISNGSAGTLDGVESTSR